MENCLSLASMLRCLIHILVRAEPMSRVPPETQTHTRVRNFTWTHHKPMTKRLPGPAAQPGGNPKRNKLMRKDVRQALGGNVEVKC